MSAGAYFIYIYMYCFRELHVLGYLPEGNSSPFVTRKHASADFFLKLYVRFNHRWFFFFKSFLNTENVKIAEI